MADAAVLGRAALVLAVVLAVRGLARTARARVRKHGWHALAWRWLTGQPWHGRPVTDRGWLRPGTRALTRTGHATRWQHLPRWRQAVHRSGGTLAVLAALALAVTAPRVLAVLLLAAAGLGAVAGAAAGARWLAARKKRRTWLIPLHRAGHETAGHPRAARAASWISVETDRDGAVTSAELRPAPGWPADPADEKRLVTTASAVLGIEAPEASWRRGGPAPALLLARSQPPPARVEMAALLEQMRGCSADELLIGTGKHGKPVKVSLNGDSPHLAVSMGTGAGKSNLASWLLLQVLLAGGIGLVLDAKRGLSYPWLLKDEAGGWSRLPCAGYARTTSQLHEAMAWLSDELNRRNEVAMTGIDAAGRVRADVGPRLFVVAEEMNLAVQRLRAYWAGLRESGDPARSPAFTGLGEVAFAGRQVHMHEVLIGQMLTAEATGSRDSAVRENCGIKMLARYGPKGWRVMCDDVPMPPPPSHAGRVQVVTGRRVREAQVPLFDPLLARRLLLEAGMMSPPSGMPCVPRVPLPGEGGAEQPVVPGTRPAVPGPGGVLTLSEAVAEGVVACSLAALRKASQRPGFPARKGLRGVAGEWDALELAEWDGSRRNR